MEVTRCDYLILGVILWEKPPLWSSGQSSWLQIHRPGSDSRCYQIYWELVGLERGQLSLVSTIEELLGRNSSGSGLESREYGRRDPSLWPRGTLYPQKLTLTSQTRGGCSVGIVRSRTQITEFSFFLVYFSNRKSWVSLSVILSTLADSGHGVSFNPVRATLAYLCTSGFCLLARLCTSSDYGDTAGNSLENRFPEYRAVMLTNLCRLGTWVCLT
jgi:hypothetical protein